MVEYEGIKRSKSPDWLGWFILDLLEKNPDAPKEHIDEIKQLLDYEIRLFHFHNKK